MQHTWFAQVSASLLIATKEGESKPQTNGQDEEGFTIGGSTKLKDKFSFKKGSPPNQMHLHWSFSCVGLCCAEAATFGVLPTTANSLYKATASS